MPMPMQEFLEHEGYVAVRQLPSGKWIGVSGNFFYTAALCVGLTRYGYHRRYCYAQYREAIDAAVIYDGIGDPSGPWITVKGGDQERLGPGAKQQGEADT